MIKIKLTDRQFQLISAMLYAGLDQHTKFLLHDDWDADKTKRERHECLYTKRQFDKAIKMWHGKLRVKK